MQPPGLLPAFLRFRRLSPPLAPRRSRSGYRNAKSPSDIQYTTRLDAAFRSSRIEQPFRTINQPTAQYQTSGYHYVPIIAPLVPILKNGVQYTSEFVDTTASHPGGLFQDDPRTRADNTDGSSEDGSARFHS